MKKIIIKILLLIAISLPSSCGFKLIDESTFNNFKIDQIQSSGDKRINFKIKNNLLINSSQKSKISILIDLETKKIRNIKEKNIKNQITKYETTIISNILVKKLSTNEEVKFSISVTSDYLVGINNAATITNERKITDYLTENLSKKILEKINSEFNDN